MINVHTASGAAVLCVALAFIGWAIFRAAWGVSYYGGRAAFFAGEPYSYHWSGPRKAGWESAWREHLIARRGARG
jgi:hypothetical protein